MAQWLLIPSGSIGLCVEPKLFSSCNIDSHQLIFFSSFQSAQVSSVSPKIWNSHMRKKKAQHLFQDLTLICVFNFFQQITSSILPLRKTWKKTGWYFVLHDEIHITVGMDEVCVHGSFHPYPVRLRATVASFKLSQFHLTNEVCVSAVFCYYSFRMILKDLTFVQNSLSSPVASYFSYHFFAEHPIWSNLLLTSICSVWFSTQVPNVHFIL